MIRRILRIIHAHEGQRLLEISPGQGTLTEGLLGSDARLDVIEPNQNLVPLLELKFSFESRFSLHQGDALKFNFISLVEGGEKLRMVGNLSYNTSTSLIFHLLERAPVAEDTHFMLQKEVVECLAAMPGGGDWGRLSVMVQYHCRVEHLFNVGLGALSPLLKAGSAIVCLIPFAESLHPARDPRLLGRMVREVLDQCHKTLRNTLKPPLSVKDIGTTEVNLTLRPEQLDLVTLTRLANRLAELSSSR